MGDRSKRHCIETEPETGHQADGKTQTASNLIERNRQPLVRAAFVPTGAIWKKQGLYCIRISPVVFRMSWAIPGGRRWPFMKTHVLEFQR